MIFSRWRASGGYDYFEAGAPAPIGDDLPVPSIREVAGIGAPSTELGRALPASARHVGVGKVAVGLVTPMRRAAKIRLEGDEVPTSKLRWLGYGVLALGAYALWQSVRYEHGW